jgi:hypothetical protein
VQTPGYVAINQYRMHDMRLIPLDGRPHLPKDARAWVGDSRGHWEGNTLVVDTTNFNGKVWFDIVGNFQSDASHVIERFTRVAADKISYEATIEDSKLYTRPWKLALSLRRVKDEGYELIEEACIEGNRDVEHLLRH